MFVFYLCFDLSALCVSIGFNVVKLNRWCSFQIKQAKEKTQALNLLHLGGVNTTNFLNFKA